MGLIAFIDWLLGRAERRAEREAYLKALETVALASKANADALHSYFDMVKSSYAAAEAATKGWTVTDQSQAVDEFLDSHNDLRSRLPEEIAKDPKAVEAWLMQEIEHI